jgi:HEAT repeat protein
VQEAVIEALGQIGHAARPALPALTLEAGRNTDIDLAVTRAVDQILLSAENADLPSLKRQLRHPDDTVRLRAAKALGKLGPAAKYAVPDLTASLADDDGDVRRAALASLRSIDPKTDLGEAAVNAIALDLKDPDPANRLRAVKALGTFGPAAGSALQAAAEDRDPDVRKLAVELLARLGA